VAIVLIFNRLADRWNSLDALQVCELRSRSGFRSQGGQEGVVSYLRFAWLGGSGEKPAFGRRIRAKRSSSEKLLHELLRIEVKRISVELLPHVDS
jgi:hypothetical protein